MAVVVSGGWKEWVSVMLLRRVRPATDVENAKAEKVGYRRERRGKKARNDRMA